MDVKDIAVSIMVTCVALPAYSEGKTDAFLALDMLHIEQANSYASIVVPFVDPCPDPIADCGMPGGAVAIQQTAGQSVLTTLEGYAPFVPENWRGKGLTLGHRASAGLMKFGH